MPATPPTVGDVYVAQSTDLIRSNRGVRPGSSWVITCTIGRAVSLHVKHDNANGWSKITILKAVFGENFRLDLGVTVRQTTYGEPTHFHGEVGPSALLLPR